MPKTSLRELQRWMRELLETRGLGEMTDSSADSQKQQLQILGAVAPSNTLRPEQRVDIYSKMYVYRLVDVLTSDFRAVAYAAGEHAWYHLTRDYIKSHPSRNQNLNFFNAAFPAYLKTRRDLKHYQFLAELASLEWASMEVIFSRTANPPDLTKLETLPAKHWEEVTFRAAPTLRLFQFNYPVNQYYQAFREDKHPSIPTKRASWLAVQRKEYTVWRITLSRAMYQMLTALVAGKTLRESVKSALKARVISGKELEASISNWFRDWVSDGYFEEIVAPAKNVKVAKGSMFSGVKGGKVKSSGKVKIERFGAEAKIKSRGEAAIVKK
ncbi:MAG: putative DNA-binding domain-containing protein [Planctomycetota bacterium]